MQKEKTIIIIPAWNEEKNIGKTIDLIKKTKISCEIIVINDGSTDKTAEIAKRKGSKVKKLEKNRGKSGAFFAGIREAIKQNPTAVVTLDADMTNIPKNGLKDLIYEAKQATKEKKEKMIIATQIEGNHSFELINLSGIRAFSKPALIKIYRTKNKGKSIGFGIETYLNKMFSKKTNTIKTPFKTLTPYRAKNAIRQIKEIEITEMLIAAARKKTQKNKSRKLQKTRKTKPK